MKDNVFCPQLPGPGQVVPVESQKRFCPQAAVELTGGIQAAEFPPKGWMVLPVKIQPVWEKRQMVAGE